MIDDDQKSRDDEWIRRALEEARGGLRPAARQIEQIIELTALNSERLDAILTRVERLKTQALLNGEALEFVRELHALVEQGRIVKLSRDRIEFLDEGDTAPQPAAAALEAERASTHAALEQVSEATILAQQALRDILADDDAERARIAERTPTDMQPETKPTYREVYTRYRRRHAKNPKVTIREVCEEMGVDYDNTRAAKYRATKRGK